MNEDGDLTGASWNRVLLWMRQLESLKRVSRAPISLKGSGA
jgi:hypothetical protein